MVKFPKDIKKIISTLTANRFEGYAVGACVRDSMEGMEPVGWDIATNARLDDIKAMFEDCRVLSEKLGVVRLEFIEEILEGEDVVGEEGIIVDIHTYRDKNGNFTDSIDEDLKRADFTCDAIGYNGMGFANPLGGIDDIKNKKIKSNTDIDALFAKNPIRIMEVFAMMGQLGFEVGADIKDAMKKHIKKLNDADLSRVGEEFGNMLNGDYSGKTLKQFIAMGGVHIILSDEGFNRLMPREKSDMLMLCENIGKTQKVVERRLGLFYSVLSKNKQLKSIERINYDEPIKTYLIDAANDLTTLYFCNTSDSIKKFLFKHETMDRFYYLLNLEKAQRIVFEWDMETKIRSTLYHLEQVLNSHEPVFREDLAIDEDDLLMKGIAADRQEAYDILGWVTQHMHIEPKDNVREICLEYAKKYKKNAVSRKFAGVRWMK